MSQGVDQIGYGSSPLTRGKHGDQAVKGLDDRLIPAHAGKTDVRRVGEGRRRAHPRSRGENVRRAARASPSAGSSPLTRGKQDRRDGHPGIERLIPAHAGKTAPAPTSHTSRRAHPRSRGENQIDSSAGNRDPGSSPLTRGKPRRTNVHTVPRRLIPAHAGKTRPACRPSSSSSAHPRSRGENVKVSVCFASSSGSSPLTRGKLRAGGCVRFRWRLIPAHAGKTMPPGSPRRPARAHPRSRGENPLAGMVTRFSRGSSPLTRGKRLGEVPEELLRRLIPAHAGKTMSSRPASRMSPAHPRSRGENPTPREVVELDDGSSPLTRGKPSRMPVMEVSCRLIPAHAGKTTSRLFATRPPTAHPRSRGENHTLSS